MPVKHSGYQDFHRLNLTRVGGSIKPVKSEDTIDPTTGEPVKFAAVWNADESIGQTVVLDTENRPLLEVYIRSTTAPNIHMDISPDGSNWIEDVHTWSGLTNINEGYLNASRYVRIRTEPAGVSGTDTITILLIAK